MYEVYDKWPQIAKESFESDYEPIEFEGVNHIIFSGMGGSGALGDIFAAILSNSHIHVSVVKGYILPKTVKSDTLIVTTSVSGNTAETLTVLDSSKQFSRKIIAFSSGGKIQEYCSKKNIEHRHIEQIHSPRASFTKFLYSMLKVLAPALPIKKESVIDSITEMENLSKQICSLNLTDKNPSLSLADWIKGIPIIYYPWGLQAAAIRFKGSLQENAKTHAMAEDIIEACHNGIVSWEKQSNVQPILIEGDKDYYKTKERWKILREYFNKNKIDYREVFSVKGDILSKLINLIYLLDYTSIYLAVLSKMDPSPVKSIDFIKKKL
jgi:glucose/mannose-6-phosphate isomerase